MITEEQGQLPVSGFTVYDTLIMVSIIEKILRGGLVQGKEVSFVAILRQKALAAAQEQGIDIEKAITEAGENAVQGG